jgi:hypothetical protein
VASISVADGNSLPVTLNVTKKSSNVTQLHFHGNVTDSMKMLLKSSECYCISGMLLANKCYNVTSLPGTEQLGV